MLKIEHLYLVFEQITLRNNEATLLIGTIFLGFFGLCNKTS